VRLSIEEEIKVQECLLRIAHCRHLRTKWSGESWNQNRKQLETRQSGNIRNTMMCIFFQVLAWQRLVEHVACREKRGNACEGLAGESDGKGPP
jgi:hypothetical protein